MRHDELLEIVNNGESSKIEFKTDDVHPTSLAEEIVAFANFEGGMVLIGVDDSGVISGCTKRDIEEFIINLCRNNIKPSIIPIIEKIVINEKSVLIVNIPKGDTPYSTNKGLYFIRVGSTKQTPSQQELLRLFQKRNIIQFDETPVIKGSIESIDVGKVNTYLGKLGQSPINDENMIALSRELVTLSIMLETDNNNHPTLGGILAFGKNPQKFFPSFSIQCGAYKGDDFLSDTIREKDLTGTLDEQIEDAIAFLKLTMPQSRELERSIQQTDSYLYPIEALREGIVNAVCHRDYTITGASIRIFLFENRLEIRSPGGLPNTLTIDNMLYRQFTRNQMIASFLTGYGYMERRGKGILRMLKICIQNNISCEFLLTHDKNEFVTIFKCNQPTA